MFDRVPNPKSAEENENIQSSFKKHESEEHQMVEIYKGIEVMEKYRADNEFILSALQERCEDYKETLDALETSITQLAEFNADNRQDDDIEHFRATIDSTHQAFEDYEKLSESLRMQQKILNSEDDESTVLDTKFKEVEAIQTTLESMHSEETEPSEYVLKFIQSMQNFNNTDDPEEHPPQNSSGKKPKKKGKKPVSKPLDEEGYQEHRTEINEITEKYTSQNEDLKSGSRKNSEASINPQIDEDADQTPEEKLHSQLERRDQEIEEILQEIEKLKTYKDANGTEETMLKDKQAKYEPTLKELMDKNKVGSSKIETLFEKVRKSREKIDQVLGDLRMYQQEFEGILIAKRCKPAKLKISRKIMEARLDCYKNFLLHLQSVIDELQREIRQFKIREKEYVKQAKIAGVGVAQKHNTYADQLKKKIKMLEGQITKGIQVKSNAGKKQENQVRNKSLIKRASSKPAMKPQNVAKDLKNAKSDLKDRSDQIQLLSDMLNSSVHENKMKDNEIDRLQGKLRRMQGGSTNAFKSISRPPIYDKQNRTENTFLPESLRGAVRAEANFPFSNKSGLSPHSNKSGLPSVKGASTHGDNYMKDYDDVSQRSQSQVSLAISQKRGSKIVKDSRKKMEQYKEPEKKARVTNVEQYQGEKDGLNLKIEEEDPTLEEGTMRFNMRQHQKRVPTNHDDEESGFEEGSPDDYNLNEI